MAEAILTMTILGVIAAIMIAVIKPVQYRDRGFKVKLQKIYSELYDATNTVIIECTSNWDLATIYDDCDTRTTTHLFGNLTNANEFNSYKRYLKFKDDCEVTQGVPANSSCKKMPNDSCICFYKSGIWIDANDNEGPNLNNLDQATWPVSIESGDDTGITASRPK